MEELNREAFRDGYFLSGDLGTLDDEGRLTITGRKKLLIEVGGYKVDPIEVEDVVGAHPGVAEAVVVGVETKGAGRGAGQGRRRAQRRDRRARPDRVLPAAARELQGAPGRRVPEEIPKSPLGKILRKYLI